MCNDLEPLPIEKPRVDGHLSSHEWMKTPKSTCPPRTPLSKEWLTNNLPPRNALFHYYYYYYIGEPRPLARNLPLCDGDALKKGPNGFLWWLDFVRLGKTKKFLSIYCNMARYFPSHEVNPLNVFAGPPAGDNALTPCHSFMILTVWFVIAKFWKEFYGLSVFECAENLRPSCFAKVNFS